MSDEPFEVYECSLARLATGRSCSNLRELLEAIRTVPDTVLEHHMMRCALEDHFELDEFPNEFARWCWDSLGDHLLGEQLALIDPYHLRYADKRERMGQTGRDFVREHFLLTRQLRDYLTMLQFLVHPDELGMAA